MVADINKKSLIIVESPTKAKTISNYLKGKPFKVVASKGHIVDLNPTPDSKDGVYGIYVDEDFRLDYVVVEGKEELISEMKKDLKDVEQLILASDEDREGESIAYHLKTTLKPEVPTYRMVFHEITKRAIEKAFKNCRDVDMNLVKAQEARRAVDRLQGYGISPLLSQKLGSKYSAGRVQSPALKLIVEKEKVRRDFKVSSYFSVEAMSGKDNVVFPLILNRINDNQVASSASYESESGILKDGFVVLDEKEAVRIASDLEGKSLDILEVNKKERVEKPYLPFTTSTLQQEANTKLGKSSRETMSIAQKLYENGFITYMRTDSPTLSTECIDAAREQIRVLYGEAYLSKEVRNFTAKNPGAQEAHEAIRPAGDTFRVPKETGLSGDELKLYTLIWKRTLQSQMSECIKSVTSVVARSGAYTFTASGTTVVFKGFRKVYESSKDEGEREIKLPSLTKGDELRIISSEAKEHKTQAPARYNEATLVKKLESEEIGRPSTYATIISTLLDKKYVVRQGHHLVPTFTGFFVDSFLERSFEHYIDYDFTKEMEAQLDEIASGDLDKNTYLSRFWFGNSSFPGLKQDLGIVKATTKAGEVKDLTLSGLSYTFNENNQNIHYDIKIGKFGPYLASDYFDEPNGKNKMASIDEKKYFPGTFTDEEAREILFHEEEAPVLFDKYQLKNGKFGTYFVRLEDNKSISFPSKKTNPEDVSEEYLDLIFSLPKLIGTDKEGNDAYLRLGPYGFYAQYKGKNFRVSNPNTVTLEDVANERGSGPIKDFGIVDGKKLEVVNGKYGPYIKWGEINAPLSAEDKKAPEKIEMEKAYQIAKDHEAKAGATAQMKSERDFTLSSGETVHLLNGRYGYYLKKGNENIPLPQNYKKNASALNESIVEEVVSSFKPKAKAKKSKKTK